MINDKYLIVPVKIATDPNLRPATKAVILAILALGEGNPTNYGYISSMTGMSLRTTRLAISEAIKIGILRKYRGVADSQHEPRYEVL